MVIRCEKEEVFQFSVTAPLYLPFFNRWGRNAYYKYEKFSLNPFNLYSSSTSGSPVVVGNGCFFGFLNENGGTFSYDGAGTLTIHCAEGQALYYNEDCNPYTEWQRYNAEILKNYEARPNEKFWGALEYCTWVEQKRAALENGSKVWQSSLNEKFVYDYMKRVNKLGLPKGKLTIDDGWDVRYADDGKMMYGNWEIDREKFPNMERLVKDIAEEGFVPGLWFAPFTFTPNSILATKHPELIGSTFSQDAEAEAVRKLMFIEPDEILLDYYHKIFSYYADMGFKKFKLDMSYGDKSKMKQLLKMIYGVIKNIDNTIEVEAHIPDIFVSRYCDTVRINDVNFDEEGKWREVTHEHYKVCKFSSPDKILNLDHLGTNTPMPNAEEFLEHSKLLLTFTGGYPCVSTLPDLYEQKISDAYVDAVCAWNKENGGLV